MLEIATEGDKQRSAGAPPGRSTGRGRSTGWSRTAPRSTLEGWTCSRSRTARITGNQAYINGADLARQLGALPPQGSLPDRAMLGALNLMTRAKGELAKRRAG